MRRSVINPYKFSVTRSVRPHFARCVFLLLALGAVLLMLLSPMARAQQGPPAGTEKSQSFLDSMEHWFNEQVAKINSAFDDTQKKMENFGQGASDVAKSTAEGAKNAADVVSRLPNARVISGHEKCQPAANGAPDCAAAADALCKAQGFKAGKGLDMTSAVTCPPRVYLSGRSSGSECKPETFVSRAVCQ